MIKVRFLDMIFSECRAVALCMRRPSPPPKLDFKADRPFYYLLLAHKKPVFLGFYQGIEFAQQGLSSDYNESEPVAVGNEQMA